MSNYTLPPPPSSTAKSQLDERVEQIFEELFTSIKWEPEYETDFFLDIANAGFNRATLKQAFVLAQQGAV